MRKNNKAIFIFLISVLCTLKVCYSQDTIKSKILGNTSWHFENNITVRKTGDTDYEITHNPEKKDSIFCKLNSKLISEQPTKYNYSKYYKLACSLWELNKLTEAESMFLKIVDSKEPFYVDTYYHSSDISSDKKTNTYGYGSYTSNYKNYSCRYLTKIYIEERKYDKALTYIEFANKTHVAVQNCGTGYFWYKREIDGLYALCYEGLGKHDSIIKMFLPQYANHSSGILINALKKAYTKNEINNYLKIAENSVICVIDTFQSSSYTIHNYGKKNETKIESKYTLGKATTMLFGRLVTLENPNLKNGEIVSKELYINDFKESQFYNAMIGEE